MAFYMVQFAYTSESLATMVKNPQDRSLPVKAMIEKLGGRLLSVYYCFGEYDGIVLLEAPDDTAANAISLAAVTPGHLKAIKTTKLFTVEETIESMHMAGDVVFPGPSRG